MALELRGTCKVGKIKIIPYPAPPPPRLLLALIIASLSHIVAGLLRSAFGPS